MIEESKAIEEILEIRRNQLESYRNLLLELKDEIKESQKSKNPIPSYGLKIGTARKKFLGLAQEIRLS